MIRFAENLNKMITAGLGGALEAPRTEVALGHRISYMDASGAVATFNTNIADLIRSLRVDMQPIQEGSGDPSPDNIRPITGRDSVTVWRTGINVWDEEWEVGGIDNEGNKVSQANRIRSKNFINITPETNYYIVIDGTAFTLYPFFYDRNGGFITRGAYLGESGVRKSPVDAYKMMFYVWKSAWTDFENHPDISINYPSNATEYEPYDGQSVTIQLGQTVYGGTVDVTTGVLTVDRVYEDIKANADSYRIANADTANQYFYSRFDSNTDTQNANTGKLFTSGTIGNPYAYSQLGKNDVATVLHSSVGAEIRVGSFGYNTLETWVAYIKSQTACGIVYPLAEPFAIQLTPASLSTLKGDNNVWSDAGNISLEYPYYEETEGY